MSTKIEIIIGSGKHNPASALDAFIRRLYLRYKFKAEKVRKMGKKPQST